MGVCHVMHVGLNYCKSSLIDSVPGSVVLLLVHRCDDIFIVSCHSLHHRQNVSAIFLIGALESEEGMILEVGIISFVGVSVGTDIEAHSAVDHGVKEVMEDQKFIEALGGFSAADERVVGARNYESFTGHTSR